MKKAEWGPHKHFKLRGEWAELRFMSRAAEEGLRVIKPWGDSSQYDFVVESGGRFLRVQVKSTSYLRGKQYTCGLRGAAREAYRKTDIDFFAIYIIPLDAWYIIPIESAPPDAVSISISTYKPRARYAQYREAWHLLLQGEENQTQGPSTSLGMTDPLPDDNTKQ